MMWRNASSFICIFVAVVVATVRNDSHYITGSHPEDTLSRLTTENPESPSVELIQEVKETSVVELGDLLDAGDGAMATLVAGDTRLLAHRAVLVARSPVFASMFRHIPLEASSSDVEISDVEGPVLRHLLAYMYTLRAPQLPSVAPKLLAAADTYGLSLLKAECERQVAAQLSVETAAATAVLALRHASDSLKEAVIAYINAHLVQVIFTQGWADTMRSQPEDLIQVLRLLSDSRAETSPPPPATGDSQAAPTSLPPSNHSHSGEGPAAASAAPPTTHHVIPTPDGAAVSLSHPPAVPPCPPREPTVPPCPCVCSPPAAAGSGAAATATQPRSQHSQTPASAAPPTAAQTTPQPEDPAVSLLRGLSEEEKGKRLIQAAKKGAVEDLQILLEAGAEVGVRDKYHKKDTPLHWAARNGFVQAARRLLASGAEVDARNDWQSTPLLLAAQYGHKEAVAVLLEAGADTQARDADGDTPLVLAQRYEHQEIVEMLNSR